MSSGGGLFDCEDPAVWRAVREKYWDTVKLKSAGKGQKEGKLLPLDKWYQEELPVAIAGRPDSLLKHEELVKLMEWKLARGKFRPRLQQLVATNPSDTVERCTKTAFALLPDVRAAITELSSLKALGPATASAVLAAGAPDQAAFMADEAVEGIPGLTPIQYTAKHYAAYLQKVSERAQTLNKADSRQDWTPHSVELCLWTWAVAGKLQPSMLDGISAGEKRQAGESECDSRATKRHKCR
ncbi:uncharacterized protein LOC136712442 [Amia ocellicauda]|uniref:uncharacterized protein LOC136712442 n=1 Tax=Amia ocellicauda TaxID=2972642 RepID=UPI003463F761